MQTIQRLVPAPERPSFFRATYRSWLLGLAVLIVAAGNAVAAPIAGDQTDELQNGRSAKILLSQNWQLQSSCDAKATGSDISQPGFRADAWHKTSVPTTVVAALVADGTYPDPYFGMNLKAFPGMDYSSKSFFANQSMPADSPFRCSWWFRTEFETPELMQQRYHLASL